MSETKQVNFGLAMVNLAVSMSKFSKSWLKMLQQAQENADLELSIQILGLELAEQRELSEAARGELIQAAHELDLAQLREHRTRINLASKELSERQDGTRPNS